MELSKGTKDIQTALGQYCRSGEVEDLAQVPGLTPNRVSQYRRLVSNIIVDNIRSAYPISDKILGEEKWSEIALEFFKDHKCQSTQVWQLPKEFADYILQSREDLLNKFPFLFDLIRFEWAEMEVFGMPDAEMPKVEPIVQWSRSKQIAVNPERILLELSHPVHKKTTKEELQKDGPYFILIFREPKTYKARFFELAPIYLHLLDHAENGYSYGQSIEVINSSLKEPLDNAQLQQIEQTLTSLYKRGAILGFIA